MPIPLSSGHAPCAALALLVVLLAPGPVRADDAASADLSWRACLGQAFLTRATLSGRDLAADAALRECRGAERTYLSALAASPLLDEDDIAQAEPALAARARDRLLAGASTGPRPFLR